MEIGSETQDKSGLISHGFSLLRNSIGRIKSKLIKVAKKIKKIGQDDPRRITHSLKVGLALTLVSLFYYFRPFYDGFGEAGIWAVLTVVVIFEFTVGATLSKGLNRGFATLLAGALGIGAEYLASLFGKKGQPIVIGFLVFLLAGACTFTRFIPNIKKKYDYGVLIFILTFSLVSVSGYRVDKILELAHQRLSTILIGGAACMMISIFLCPAWAGEDLHNLIASNLEKVAMFLEGFGNEYFKFAEDGTSDAIVISSDDDKSFLRGYKSVLNSKANEESLANFAWWEPGHGGFKYRHPWKQYLKIGVLTRQCAYQIEALHSFTNSEPKESSEFQRNIHQACRKMSVESGKALKELASSIKSMASPSSTNADLHIQNCKTAVDELNIALQTHSNGKGAGTNLLEIIPDVTVASILEDIIKCIKKISESVLELSQQASFKCVESNKTAQLLLHRGTVNPVLWWR